MLSPADPQEILQAETAELNTLLYQAIEEIAGRESTSTITQLHRLCHAWRRGVPDAGRKLISLVAALDEERLRVVVRAFSLLLDVANLAEDRQRVRVLRSARAAVTRVRGGNRLKQRCWN